MPARVSRFLALALVLAAGRLPAALAAEPLALHRENPRYLVFRGKATILVGSGEHYGAVVNRDFDQRRYLDTLAKDGLNLTRLFVGTYYEKPGTFGIGAQHAGPGAGTGASRRGPAAACRAPRTAGTGTTWRSGIPTTSSGCAPSSARRAAAASWSRWSSSRPTTATVGRTRRSTPPTT